jgi:uncharacterized protein (TIGR02117 family)
MSLPGRILLAPVLLMLWACAALAPVPGPAPQGTPLVPVYQVAHDGHTGIAVRRADIPPGLWPESRDFPRAEYLEVGWGNRDYYYGRDQGLRGTLGAIFPSPSVLHVAGFRGPPEDFFRDSEIIEMAVPVDGFERLIRHIHEAHRRDGALPAAPLGPGLYGDSRFYPAREQFHLLRTCNVWTAQALRAAGLPFRDAITMEGLLAQGRAIGRAVSRPR